MNFKRIFERVENHAKLNRCYQHRFDTSEIDWSKPLLSTIPLRCVRCGGEMDILSVRCYLLGAISSGANPNAIFPGYDDGMVYLTQMVICPNCNGKGCDFCENLGEVTYACALEWMKNNGGCWEG